VDRTAAPDDKVLVRGSETHPGGAVANNLAQASRLGLRAAWVGLLGNDPEARFLLGALREAGVDARHVRLLRGKRSPVSWIAVGPDGERAIYMFGNVNAAITPGHVDRHFAPALRRAMHFHTEASQVPLRAVVRAMRIARDAGARVLFDLDVPPSELVGPWQLGTEEELAQALALTDVLKPCRGAAVALTRKRDLEGAALELLKLGPRLVAITDGAAGAVLATPHEMVKVPAIPMRAKDTTGAGDAFMGGLSFALLGREPLARAGLFANACAAYCVARMGSRSQGDYDDIRALLRTIPAY
jgi:sugar/nucleoside kinase (ribokinase family)